MVLGCNKVTRRRKKLSQTLVKHRINIQPPSNFPAGFFPPHFGVKSAPALRIYFYIQMLWIAPGRGRPFSQQEELILFECSLWSLKGRIFAMEFGRFISANLTTAK